MKKPTLLIALIFFAILSVNSYANEKPYFFYGETSSMGAVPMLGLGLRTQKGIHGFDFSGDISCSPLPAHHFSDRFKMFHIKSLYLVHPKQTGIYFGVGLGIVNEPETIKLSGSAEGVIGYQWANKVFLQGNVITPFKQKSALIPVFPGLNFGVGF